METGERRRKVVYCVAALLRSAVGSAGSLLQACLLRHSLKSAYIVIVADYCSAVCPLTSVIRIYPIPYNIDVFLCP